MDLKLGQSVRNHQLHLRPKNQPKRTPMDPTKKPKPRCPPPSHLSPFISPSSASHYSYGGAAIQGVQVTNPQFMDMKPRFVISARIPHCFCLLHAHVHLAGWPPRRAPTRHNQPTMAGLALPLPPMLPQNTGIPTYRTQRPVTNQLSTQWPAQHNLTPQRAPKGCTRAKEQR